jgi:uncharacterized membrane protein YphA (DoxX/SURF4 family)
MENQKTPIANTLRKGIHWIALAIVIYIFGYAGLYKIIGVPGMMENMAARGFGESWTLFIGLAEVLGVIGLIGGLFYRPLKIISLLFLWPFAIGAFTSHMSTHDPFSLYLNALLVCIMPAVILWSDDKFKLIIT